METGGADHKRDGKAGVICRRNKISHNKPALAKFSAHVNLGA
jgi:hypothetical protein